MKNMPEKIFCWDVESTGTNVEEDRILTCYAMLQRQDGTIERDWHWTIDPGVEVAQGASDVHGMTTEWVRENGRKDVGTAISEITSQLWFAANSGHPIVAFNQRFDLSMLHHESIRHFGLGLGALVEKGLFYDPLPHDKERDKFRKGPRKLQAMCEHYGIDFNEDEAHAAEYDVLKASELSWRLLRKESKSLDELQSLLPEWKQEQDASLERYFAKTNKTNDDGSKILIDKGWPLITKKGN